MSNDFNVYCKIFNLILIISMFFLIQCSESINKNEFTNQNILDLKCIEFKINKKGIVVDTFGFPLIKKKDSINFSLIKIGETISAGDIVSTNDMEFIAIRFDENKFLQIKPNSKFYFIESTQMEGYNYREKPSFSSGTDSRSSGYYVDEKGKLITLGIALKKIKIDSIRGEVIALHNVVRHKKENQPWTKIKIGDLVTPHDFIQTQANSSVKIKFYNNQIVELKQNEYVQFIFPWESEKIFKRLE